MRIEEAPDAAHDLDLARLGHAGEAAGELLDHAVLEAAQLRRGRSAARRTRCRAPASAVDFVHHGRRVQQRLRRNAADVEAHAAERRVALDQHRLHAEVGAAERGGVAARARAEHQHLAFDVGLAGDSCRRPVRARSPSACSRARGCGLRAQARCARPQASRRRGRRPRLRPSGSASLRDTLSPTLTFSSLTTPSTGDGTSIVALSDSSVTSESSALHRVARLHQHLDDRHVLEVADVGDLDFDVVGHVSGPLSDHACGACRRASRRNGC